MTSRIGRPPHVRTLNDEGTEFGVNVAGAQHSFRAGVDGRVRAIGSIARDSALAEDRAFAKARVLEHLQDLDAAQIAIEAATDEASE